MITVMLADDNKLSLQYFSQIISWEDYGFQLISTAIDGENAWYDFQKYHPQVVIADIQMPILSGIDLAKKVLSTDPDTVFILLSSYKEFQYAHAALQLKIYDYLLKHETTKDLLIQKLADIKSYIVSEREKNYLLAKDIMYKLFVQSDSLLTLPFELPHSLSKNFDCFFLEYATALPCIQQLFPDLQRSLPAFSPATLTEYCKNLKHTVAILPISVNQYLLISTPVLNPMAAGYMLQNLLYMHFKVNFAVIILKKADTLLNCARAYHELKTSLKKLYFYPTTAVMEGIYLQNCSVQLQIAPPEKSSHLITKKTLEELDQQYEQIALSMNYTAFCQYAEHWIHTLLHYDCHLIHPKSGKIVHLFSSDSVLCDYNISGIFQWIRDKYEVLTDTLSLINFSEYSTLTSETVYLISQNYQHEFLSVDWLAEQQNVSTSNLNLQFKKETCFTPWKIIIITRLSKASELLEQEIPITQISSMTGYSSLSYFSKSFKKMYGITPEEYRRSKRC